MPIAVQAPAAPARLPIEDDPEFLEEMFRQFAARGGRVPEILQNLDWLDSEPDEDEEDVDYMDVLETSPNLDMAAEKLVEDIR